MIDLTKDFKILNQKVNDEPLVYLDNAATTQKPQQVLDVLTNYYEHDNANVHRGFIRLQSVQLQIMRQHVKRFESLFMLHLRKKYCSLVEQQRV